MTTTRCTVFALLVVFLTGGFTAVAAKPKDDGGAWLFAYFKDPADQGIYFALSRDGLHYTPLNDGEAWVKPDQPGELMRDPS
jgi:hypothetical protein